MIARAPRRSHFHISFTNSVPASFSPKDIKLTLRPSEYVKPSHISGKNELMMAVTLNYTQIVYTHTHTHTHTYS